MLDVLSLYFPGRQHEAALTSHVSSWIEFFVSHQKQILDKRKIVVEPDFEVYIDYENLCKLVPCPPPSLNAFKNAFSNSPEDFICVFSCALHFILSNETNKVASQNTQIYLNASQVRSENQNATAQEDNNFDFLDNELFKTNFDKQKLSNLEKERKVTSQMLENEEEEMQYYASILNNQQIKILVRIYNYYPMCLINELRSTHVGKFVSFNGTILQTNNVKPQVIELRFNCSKCAAEILQKCDGGRYSLPPRCSNEKCRGRFFISQKKTARTLDGQKIRVQEDSNMIDRKFNGDNSNEDKVFDENVNSLLNRKLAVIDCELLGSSIVEKCVVGEKVKICGVLKTQILRNLNDFSKKFINVDGGNLPHTKSIFVLYISVVSIINLTKMQLSPFYLQVAGKSNINLLWKDFVKEREKRKLKFLLKQESKMKRLKNEIPTDKIKQENEQEVKEDDGEESDDDERQIVIDLDEAIDLDSNVSLLNCHRRKKKKEINNKNYNNNSIKNNNLFTQNELSFIHDIFYNENNKFYLLVASLAPNILGKNIIKSGLALCLLGGVPIFDDNNILRRRGDIHAILIGDSGLGKSELLRLISEKSERGIYVCGNGTSRCGLTATVIRDNQTNDFALQAGALVLADSGICCIDELDKMPVHEQQTFLEAMEQQSISVAKAGIVCSLSARTTIIAAANPKDGKYDKSKGFFENIKMSHPLVSRFDLIFVISDNVDSVADDELSKHVIQLRGGSSSMTDIPSSSTTSFSSRKQSNYDGIHSSLIAKCAEQEGGDLLPTKLIHTFVRYARTYIQPKLSKEAAEEIKKFYLKLREKKGNRKNSNEIYPTTRQLEAIIRLSQARARGDLSETVTRNHVLEVFDIYMHTAVCNFHNDVQDIRTATGRSIRAKSANGLANNLKNILRRLAMQSDKKISKSIVLDCAQKVIETAGATNVQASHLVDILNNEGLILNKGNAWELSSILI